MLRKRRLSGRLPRLNTDEHCYLLQPNVVAGMKYVTPVLLRFLTVGVIVPGDLCFIVGTHIDLRCLYESFPD